MKFRKGFTLIELLIVLAIIGALMAIGIPIYTTQLAKAKARSVASNLKSIAQTIANAVLMGDFTSNDCPDLQNYVKGINTEDYKACVKVDTDAGTADVFAGYKGNVDTGLVEEDLVGCDATDVANLYSEKFSGYSIGCVLTNISAGGF